VSKRRYTICRLSSISKSKTAGDKCIYRHALPPGYVLKSLKKDEDEEEKITLEQYLETARLQLPPSSELKPVTAESFEEWHKAKKKVEAEASNKKELAKERGTGITGREYFQSGEYREDEQEEDDGEDWDLSEFRKGLEQIMEEGETFQLGNGNPQIVEDNTEEKDDSGKDDNRI
jgi:zinc finger CCCH domain-containing protein 15